MILIKNAKQILTLEGAARKEGRRVLDQDLSVLSAHAILIEKNKIKWIGPQQKIPKPFFKKIKKEISAKNKIIMPTFVECHTHTVFAGERYTEFEMRNTGVSYQEIASRGGGILSTRKAIVEIPKVDLLKLTQKRVDQFTRQGVATIEIKSGYGLDLENEIKCLEVMKKLKGANIIKTFLGAHAIPKEFGNGKEYLDFLTEFVFPEVKKKKLAERVDIFIEKGFFSKEEGRQYLRRAQKLGFDLVVHADQLSLSGGTDLAVELGALSADHIIQIQDKEIKKLANSNVTGVLLPLADLYMKCAYPPARKLIDAGARVAISTDFNPGSSPSQDIQLTGLLARLEMKMTLPEVIVAYTLGAAYALNRQSLEGSLEVGKKAQMLFLEDSYRGLFYSSTETCVTHRFFEDRLEKLDK
ncbi:MAG: imidazolonepropionase [Bdellovibrionaceae bacterium]|nr:imidazolonepropionase [Pseudobdellovibrionaceae bacterium]